MLLDAIGNIYAAESANYFILESQHTLSQFAERVAKLPEAQAKYFELLEFIVFSLNYVPCKELFSVSVLLKSSTSHACSITAVRTLLKLARHDPVFSDVLREVGLLEVLVNLLHKYAALLKEPSTQQQPQNNDQGELRPPVLQVCIEFCDFVCKKELPDPNTVFSTLHKLIQLQANRIHRGLT